MIYAKGNEILDETGKQLAILMPTNITRREAALWTKLLAEALNAAQQTSEPEDAR